MRLGHWDARFGISGDMALAAALDAGAGLEVVNAALAAVGIPGLRVVLSRVRRCGIDCARAEVRWDGGPDGPASPGAEAAAGGAHAQPPVGAPTGARAPEGPGGAHRHGGSGRGDGRGDGTHAHAAAPRAVARAPGTRCGTRADAAAAGAQAGTRAHAEAAAAHGGARTQGGDDRAHGGAHAGTPHGHAAARAAGAPPHAHPGHPHRPYAEVRRLLQAAPLPAPVRERALAVFARLAEAEGRVHGVSPEDVHLHEVGSEDAIGDVVGTCAALHDLGLESLTVSVLPAGGGEVHAAHGVLPVPAPATAHLLRGFDLWPGPVAAELVTPTGAALLAALARPASGWPSMRLHGCGWGAGSRDFPDHPNACRLVWGEATGEPGGAPWRRERLVEIECHLDDQTPEGVGHVFDRLLAVGALDVALSPALMKKQRAATRLWALVPPGLAEAAARCLFTESTTLGLRVREVERWSLPREVVRVATPYGAVGVKLARMDGAVVNAAPEFDDCRRVALAAGVPLKQVVQAALAALPWSDDRPGPGGAPGAAPEPCP